MENSFNFSPQQVLKKLETSNSGIKDFEKRILKYGKNELIEKEKPSILSLILEQFKDQLVIILLASAFISFVLAYLEGGDEGFVEPVVILLILIANAVVGVVQETNAENAIEALKEYSPAEARVIRNGEQKVINAVDLVPGDIIKLTVGDLVPADARVIEISSSSLKVDQSILTGEPISVAKQEQAIKDTKAVKQDQVNILFSGTTVTVGKCIACVVQTGANTAIGQIHCDIQDHDDEKTPLKIQLDEFGDQLAKIISVVCILVWLINIRHFNDESHGGSWIKGSIYYFKIAVALAVAAIPEGLAVIITTCLALGTQKMAKEGAIVRKLASVETLGCTSVICSDKTGTLTTNQMSVRKVAFFDQKDALLELDVTGNTYGPEGLVKHNSNILKNPVAQFPALEELSTICSTCNDSKITYNTANDSFNRIGEPTEAALYTLVEKLGSNDPKIQEKIISLPDVDELEKLSFAQKEEISSVVNDCFAEKYKRLNLLEFSRDRKSMSVIVSAKESTARNSKSITYLHCKGAPESVLDRCSSVLIGGNVVSLTNSLRKKIQDKFLGWADQKALRVLGFARVVNPQVPSKLESSDFLKIESEMTFVGLVGMLDPPRPEVKDAIQKCRTAGIRVVVITGDNKKTAESICRQIGIFSSNEDLKNRSFTGHEFDAMTPQQKLDACLNADLFSRTEPSHKSELVDILKSKGYIVAMTGDGVNDAPALKKADIGVAMGTGTDVARLASDMVLADDNFSTIVSAVKEGRSIYANTKQFIRYLISSNIGEVVSIFLTVVLGMPEALIPVQLLWVNLVTDGLPATALGFNPAGNDIMTSKPRNSEEPLVTKWLFFRYMVIGTYVGFATVFGYAWWFIFYEQGPQIAFSQLSNFHQCSTIFPEIGCEMFTDIRAHKATTMSLSILVVVEMFNAINSLSENESLLTFPLWKNMYLVLAIALSMVLHFIILYVPFFTSLFQITPLNTDEWIAVLLISAPVIFIDEFLKYVSRLMHQSIQPEKLKIE